MGALMTEGGRRPAAARIPASSPGPRPAPGRAAGAPRPVAPEAPSRIDSATLMGGGRKLLIEHDGEVYTLQLTRQNKLLLTK